MLFHRPHCWGLILIAVLGDLEIVPPPQLRAEEISATVITVDGESFRGVVSLFTADEIAITQNANSRSFKMRDVLQIRFDHKRLKPHLAGSAIFLANGDRLAAHPQTIDDTAAQIQWQAFPAWKLLRVPLETIAGFVLEIPEIPIRRQRILRAVMNRAEKTDLVDLQNGDQASGEFVALTSEELRLQSQVGETKIPRRNVRFVTMNRELMSFPKRTGPALLLSLIDGSQITVTEAQMKPENRLAVKAVFGAELELPLTAIIAIRGLGGRAVYLSDLTPTEYKHQPYLKDHWELKADKNVLGLPLRLGGEEFPKGLGLHSRSVVRYDLKGEYQSFQALAGIDSQTVSGGNVIFAVDVDGKTVLETQPQTARNRAIKLPIIPLVDAKQFTLRVEFSEFGDVRDYANFCDAVLIKK